MAKTYFFWDPLEDNIVQERDESSALVAEYTTEPELYGNLITQDRGGVQRQYHYDALGSTLALTDDNQQVTDTRAYTAFGEIAASTGNTTFPFQYVGQKGDYFESMTSSTVARRRIYDPRQVRWLNEWTEGRPGFVYVANSPITFSDPAGIGALWTAARLQQEVPANSITQYADQELVCPGQCESPTKCTFKISLRVDCTSGKPVIKFKLEYLPTRPDKLEDLAITDCGPLACYGGFNRIRKGEGMEWTLNSGEVCSITQANFPSGNPWPILDLSPACAASVSFTTGPGWGEYSIVNTTSISTGFYLTTQCHCGTGFVDIPGPRNPNEDSAIATTTGELYFGHGRSNVSCP